MKALLDTHVLVRWTHGDKRRLSRAQARILERAGPGDPLLVCDVTLWEVANLHSLGRIRLDRPLRDWLDGATAPPLVEVVAITPAIASETAALPRDFTRDPVDRILVATARVLGATLLTNDQAIIDASLVATRE